MCLLIAFRRFQSAQMAFSPFPAAPFVCLREISVLHCDARCLQMFVTTCRADRPRLIFFPPITHTSKACKTSDLIQSRIEFTVISHWSWRDLAQTDRELRVKLWCNCSWHMFLFWGKTELIYVHFILFTACLYSELCFENDALFLIIEFYLLHAVSSITYYEYIIFRMFPFLLNPPHWHFLTFSALFSPIHRMSLTLQRNTGKPCLPCLQRRNGKSTAAKRR